MRILRDSFNTFLGYQAGRGHTTNRLTGSNNVFLGYQAGLVTSTGGSNVFIGNEAGRSNTSAGSNVFLGNSAGYSTSIGSWNVMIGDSAGYANTTGTSNVFIGNLSGTKNISSVDNVFIGYRSGRLHTSGNNNVFIGSWAGSEDETGTRNVFIGYHCGMENISGINNTFLGDGAGGNNISGGENVYLGRIAGYMNETGSNNVFIGRSAGYNETGSNKLYISNSGTNPLLYGEFDNQLLRINGKLLVNGNIELATGANRYIVFPDKTRSLYIGGQVGFQSAYAIHFITDNGSNSGVERLSIVNDKIGINTTGPTQSLDVNGTARIRSVGSGPYSTAVSRTSDGTLTTSTSDVRLKENIRPINDGLAKVLNMRGVYFTWMSEPSLGNRLGMIAQELENVVPELVFTNEVDGYKGINYPELTAVLVEAIKEQQNTIESQSAKIDQQQSELESLKSLAGEVQSLKAEMEALKAMIVNGNK
jgi:hypothetical protein